jgi:hypothetical protein
MDNTQHDNFVFEYLKKHAVWKPLQEGTPDFLMDARKGQWPLADTGNGNLDRSGKQLPQSFLMGFIPVSCFKKFSLSLRPEDDSVAHFLRVRLRRTLVHGMAEAGSATCSATRRSRSASCLDVRENSFSR